MDRIQQRVINIALQIPEYVGYQAKERRRDEDKLVRRQLAAKYEAERTHLARIARKAPLDEIVEIENLDQKLQRLVARLSTAPTGYAGWFDSGQIGDQDLDQLTQFDATLAGGATKLGAAFEELAGAIKAGERVQDAVDRCADLLDDLNAQFDQREQFLAQGKKPAPPRQPPPAESPLTALKERPVVPSDLAELTRLNLRDAVSFAGTDYLVAGKISYSTPTGSFWAFLLQDSQPARWLRVGPGDQVALCEPVALAAPTPLPDQLEYAGQPFTRARQGSANVTVEGVSGIKRGIVNYAEYVSPAESQLWIEDFGTEVRTTQGSKIDRDSLRVYRR